VELHEQMVRREVVLSVDRDTAWKNLADAEGLAGWLADDIELDVRAGAEGTARWSDGTERHVVVDEVEIGRRLALCWWADGEHATLVELTLDEHEEGTRLVVLELPVRVVEAVGATLARTGPPARGPQLAGAGA
jgi:uncharacterized protein YndB with AHSA1/START domain